MLDTIKSSKSWFFVALVLAICVFSAQSSIAASSSQDQFMKGLKLYAHFAPIPWKKAFYIFKKDAANNSNSAVLMARLYQTGRGVAKDEIKAQQIAKMALPKVKKLAERGISTSQFVLGLMYDFGLGTDRNIEEAMKWNMSSAKLGSKVVHWSLGSVYQFGLTGKKDWAKAVKHYKQCSLVISSCTRLIGALFYTGGNGVPKNYGKAVKWFRKGAEQGNAYAQAALGEFYENGHGVTKDYKKATAWYRKAEKLGLIEAKEKLVALKQISNFPTKELANYYNSYAWTKECYEARKDGGLPYVSAGQLQKAKTQIKAIEKKLKAQGADTDLAWKKGIRGMSANSQRMFSSGRYHQNGVKSCSMSMKDLAGGYHKYVGPKKIKKDF
jgi:TPR repeat protein